METHPVPDRLLTLVGYVAEAPMLVAVGARSMIASCLTH